MSDNQLLKDLPSGPLDHYRKQAKFCWKKMKQFIEDPELLKIKMDVWEALEKDPIFQRMVENPSTEEMKRRSAIQLNKYIKYQFLGPDLIKMPYKRKTRFMMTVNEAVAVTYPDVSIKHALGMGLFKNTLTTLGSERHKHILDAAWNGKILSCLALTEIAHGSNTKQMRTTATFDAKTQEFIINTPDFEAAKCWVGNLGKTCTIALLFAQLYTSNQCHGLHAFVVPVRDPKTLEPYPGIIVGDMGEKIGLHGIDNGFIMFKDFRIPRENLLNKTADVTPEGEYESSFSDPQRILGAALENLSTGRVGIMQECSNNLVCAVTIAVRYAAVRKQFAPNGDGNDNELPIIEYQLHQWRIFPHVAAAIVIRVFVNSFTDTYLSVVEKTTTNTALEDLSDMVSEIHAIVSGAKPLITWSARDATQEAREACGGHGFLKAARLGDLRSTIDPCVTYEGDNNVLVQQTSNWLLRQWTAMGQENGRLTTPLGTCTFLENRDRICERKFDIQRPEEMLNVRFISNCYEWLIVYLLKQFEEKYTEVLQKTKCRFTARSESQVYRAAVLSRTFLEYTALKHYWTHIFKAHASLKPTLDNLGNLYALSCLDKHLVYFYQGNFASGGQFSSFIKENVLRLCKIMKPDCLGVIDALAPTDFVINSVLGKSDGKLYENLQNVIMHNPGAMSRPSWWHEIIIPDAPDFQNVKKSKL